MRGDCVMDANTRSNLTRPIVSLAEADPRVAIVIQLFKRDLSRRISHRGIIGGGPTVSLRFEEVVSSAIRLLVR